MDLPESSTAQPPPAWVILDRIAREEHDYIDDSGDVYLELAPPPRASNITVPMSLHPVPNYDDRDKHPYVVAADPNGALLLQVSRWPFIGFDLADHPVGALLVARGFLPADADAGRDAPAATVDGVPDRAMSFLPKISNIRNVGLVTRPGSGGEDYVVAELCLDRADVDCATLFWFRADGNAWEKTELTCPSMKHARKLWKTSHDVIAHEGKLWWVNLFWGFLVWDPFKDEPVLHHIPLPKSLAGDHQVVDPPTMENGRMVGVSNGILLFVEMVRQRVDPVEETMVVVHSLDFNLVTGDPWWKWMSGNSVGVMWESHTYKAAGLPDREVPVLALVHPTDPDVIYFFLKDYLFGFDMVLSLVTEVAYKPGLAEVVAGAGMRRPPPISWRYVLAWELPPSLAKAFDYLMDDDGGARLIEESAFNDVMDEDYGSPTTTVMDQDNGSPTVEESCSLPIPDLNAVPDPPYDTPTTDLGDTPKTDLGDTPKTDLGDTPSTDLDDCGAEDTPTKKRKS